MFQSVRFHKIDHPYEFMDKIGKIRQGIVTDCDIRIDKWQTSIIYVVQVDDNFYNVDHETNRQL